MTEAEAGPAGDLGCEFCRSAVYSSGLPEVGLSIAGHVIVRRCPVCRTYWLETDRAAFPVTDGEAAAQAPDVVES